MITAKLHGQLEQAYRVLSPDIFLPPDNEIPWDAGMEVKRLDDQTIKVLWSTGVWDTFTDGNDKLTHTGCSEA